MAEKSEEDIMKERLTINNLKSRVNRIEDILASIAASKKQIYDSSINNRETKCRGRIL